MIERLQVQNYKSLKELDIRLKPLTVLVGPNAAGKSNVIDCLSFVAEVVTSGLQSALNRRGSFGDLVWGGEEDRTISIWLRWKPLNRETVPFDYSIKVGMDQGPLAIILEESGHSAGDSGKGFKFRRDTRALEYENSTISVASGLESALGTLGREVPLRDIFKSWFFYDFLTSGMRWPQPVAKQTRLAADGGNIATLLHWLHSEEEPGVFQAVEEHLKLAVPEVDKLLSLQTEAGKTYVAWREKAIPGRIPAWNMSEGSVRLVAVLLALLVPEPPLLVALETPEIHLHSYLMEYLADILKTGSQQTQIILTTHSTHLLNYLSPENLLIVKKEDGKSQVEAVEDSRALREALKTLGLGDVYHAGHMGGVP